uniref:Non-haem dioxygenase N-terminal domain-containing protein n=1 Tax=Fagus sylvatica TaxID=28930 RepID=A0A2N9F175_FAGSY
MVDTHLHQNSVQDVLDYDREKELKAFDDTKAGVKGVVDSGIVKVPPMFAIQTNELSCETSNSGLTHLQIPVIDLKDIHEGGFLHKQAVEEIQRASERWGFFQIVNHGISEDVMDDMIKGVCMFHEQPTESKAANWRDTLFSTIAPDAPNPEELPAACSYSDNVKRLGVTLLELLPEALGLKPNHLIEMECAVVQDLDGHYYPACPEPNKNTQILISSLFFYKTKLEASKPFIKISGLMSLL